MEHIEINRETNASAEVDMVIGGKWRGMYRVVRRDIFGNSFETVHTFETRDEAIAYAKKVVNLTAMVAA